MFLEDILKKKLENRCKNNLNNYVQLVANWFAYVILNNNKHEIDHSLDPPWDNSGMITDIDEQFDLNDYATFNDFIEREYTGESNASYVSGHGMYHYTYEEPFEQITLEWLTSQLYLVIKSLIEKENKYLEEWVENKNISFNIKAADDITDIILFEDVVGDFFYSYVWEIKDNVLNTHPIILFSRGKEEAINKIRKEEIKQKESQKEFQKNRKKAEFIWEKILKMYKIKYGHEIPNKIEKPLYDKKVKQLFIELYKNGVNIEEIQSIGKFLSFRFSNSVSTLISNFNTLEE
ncbi:MAG: hypothetical protein R6V14_02030 [Halanaerobiales bacterium]